MSEVVELTTNCSATLPHRSLFCRPRITELGRRLLPPHPRVEVYKEGRKFSQPPTSSRRQPTSSLPVSTICHTYAFTRRTKRPCASHMHSRIERNATPLVRSILLIPLCLTRYLPSCRAFLRAHQYHPSDHPYNCRTSERTVRWIYPQAHSSLLRHTHIRGEAYLVTATATALRQV